MTEEIEGHDEKKRSVADRLMEWLDGVEFFYDQDEQCYAAIERDSRREIHRIRSTQFQSYLSHLAWEHLNTPLSKTAKESVSDTLEAIARFNGKQYELNLRTAWRGDELWYDVGDWRAIKITSAGWRVVRKPPILFKRYHDGLQCTPEPDGDINTVFEFFNLDRAEGFEEAKLLMITYLVTALIPDIARPVLELEGSQGSAKSTTAKLIKDLIDPSVMESVAMHRDVQQMIQLCDHNYYIAFDNLSRLSDEQSDAICRACTGEGMLKRKLFTDSEDIFYHYKRLISLNGINLVARKPDLLNRALTFDLEPIPTERRMEESVLRKRFSEAKPKLLGAMFTILSNAMAVKEGGDITMRKEHRLADYLMWSGRIAVALGLTPEAFLKAFGENTQTQDDEVLEGSVLAQTIVRLAHELAVERTSYTPDNLYQKLKPYADQIQPDGYSDFPSRSGWLWKKIKLIHANLAAIGIDVRHSPSTKRPREIEIVIDKKLLRGSDGTDHTDQSGRLVSF